MEETIKPKAKPKPKGKTKKTRKPAVSLSNDGALVVKQEPKAKKVKLEPKPSNTTKLLNSTNKTEQIDEVKEPPKDEIEPISQEDWIQLEKGEEIEIIRKRNFYSTDLIFTLFDEIALEGLDGITVETLRYRLRNALNTKTDLPDNLENMLWKQICHMKSITFFLLPRPRKNTNRINQIIKLKTEPKTQHVPEDPYPYELINDKDNNIVGSCSTYNERLNITPEILQKKSLKEVEESYGNSVVIVANQDLRNNSLIPSLSNPLLNIMENQFGLLERIGRSRHTGEITSGPQSLLVTCKDSSTLFYLQKPMHKNNILTKQLFTYNNQNGLKSSVNIFHLQRFHRDIKSKKQLLIEYILKILKAKPNFRLEYIELRKLFSPAIWEKLSITKLLKSQEFRQFVKTDLQLLYREVYPKAAEQEWKRKANDQEKRIRVLEIINPDININSMWRDDDNKDYSSDEEYCGTLSPNQTIRSQVYDLILSRGKDGIFPKEIEALTGLDFYSVRTITKYFQKKNLIVVTMIDAGRQRCSKLIAKEVMEKKKDIPIEIIYSDETLDFISNVLNVDKSCLKGNIQENKKCERDINSSASGDNYKIVDFRENKKDRDFPLVSKKEEMRSIFLNKNEFIKHDASLKSNIIIPNATKNVKLGAAFKNIFSNMQHAKKDVEKKTLFYDKISSNESNIDQKLENNLNRKFKKFVQNTKVWTFIKPLSKMWNKDPNVLAKSYKKYQTKVSEILDQLQKDVKEKKQFPSYDEHLSSSDDDSDCCNSLDANMDDDLVSKLHSDGSIDEIKKIMINSFECNEKISGFLINNDELLLDKNPNKRNLDIEESECSAKRVKLEQSAKAVEQREEEMAHEGITTDMIEVIINIHSNVVMEMFMGLKPILLRDDTDDDNIYTRVFSSSDPQNYSPAKMMLMTERVNTRINFIRNVVFENKVITDFAKVHQMLIKEEQSEGNKTTIDRKSLHRIYTKLARDGALKIIKIVCKYENIIRMKNILIFPNIDINSFLESTIEQFKMSFFIYAKRKYDKHQSPEVDANSKPATISSDIRVENIVNKSDNANLDLNLTKVQYKYSRTIGRKYGYYPKFAKMRVLHEFLYYLVYDYSGQVISDEESIEIYAKFAKTQKLDPEFIQERSPLYQREISWKMFVAPLPQHKDCPTGWAIMCDVLLRLPLSILVKLFNVTYIIPELSDQFLNHPIKKHILIKNLPPDIKDAVLSYRKYIFSIHEIFCCLCYLGLAQFGPQIFCEKDQLYVYINKRAIIYDTTSSAPGYHQIEKKVYPKSEYHFETTHEMENYWNDLYMFSMKTQLGQRRCVIGKYISLEGIHGKADMLSTIKPQTHDSAVVNDVGYLPGDGLGACGTDSALWLHIKRNWVYVKNQLKPSASSLQKLTGIRKKYIDDVKPIKLSELRNIKKNTINKKRPVGNSTENQTNKSLLARKILKNKKKASVSLQPRRAVLRKVKPRVNNFPKRMRVDLVDRGIIDKMGKTRAIFCEEEDNLLLLCKACMEYLCTSSKKRPVVFTTVRDFIHKSLPYSRKTSTAYKRRIIWLKKTNDLQDKKQPLKFNLVSDYFIEKHFKRIRERFASEQIISEIEVSLSFLYLAYYAYKKFKAEVSNFKKKDDDIDDIQDFLIESTLDKFNIYEDEECMYSSPTTEDDIIIDTIKSVIHSSLSSQNNSQEWPFQLLKVYQNFPEHLLRNALNLMRDQQLISGKKAYNKASHKEGSILMCGTSYHLSFAYIFKQITKYPPSIYNEGHDFFVVLYKHFDVFIERGCSVEKLEQTHGISVNEIATLRNLNYSFDLPDDIITLDPNLHDYTDLIKELTLRYKAIMTKRNENPEDSGRDLEFWNRIENILQDFIKIHGEGKREKNINEDARSDIGGLKTESLQKALKISDLAFLLTKGLFPELDDEDRLEKLNKHFLVQYPSCNIFINDERIYENDPLFKKCHEYVVERGRKLIDKMHRESILNNAMLEDETIRNVIATLDGNEDDKKKTLELLNFIDSKNIYGATSEELIANFENPLGKLDLLSILKCLIHIGVVLRVGISHFVFVHFQHRENWSIQLYSSTSNNNGYRVRVSPWIRIDGGVCFNILTNWFGIILSYCLSYPFITLSALCKRFCYLKPVDIFFLLEFLQDLTCVKLKTYIDSDMNIFLFESCQTDEKPATITDNFDRIFVETDNLATIKFGAFINRDKTDFNCSFISTN